MNPDPLNPEDARAVLEAIEDARRELAVQATASPFWRHAAFAAAVAALVLGEGFSGLPGAILLILAMVVPGVLVASDRRRHGIFLNGYRRGSTLRITVALLAAMLAAAGLELRARLAAWPLAAKLVIPAGAFLVGLCASYAWNRAYRRELTGGDRRP